MSFLLGLAAAVQAVAALTAYYARVIPPDAVVLDLMSSWISHLPDEVSYRRVVGLGLNAAELARNPRARSARLRTAVRTDAPAWDQEKAA